MESSQIKFNTTMLKPSLCDYNDSYKLFKGTITLTRTRADAASQISDKRTLKNYVLLINWISRISNTQIGVMPM